MDAKGATFTLSKENNNNSNGIGRKHHRRHHRRTSRDSDIHPDDESLEYSASASSSVHSLSSVATGESTDSSTFADIIRVLDLEEREDLVALLKKDSKGGGGASTGGAVGGQDGLDHNLGTVNFAPAEPLEKSDIVQKHAKDLTPRVKNGVRVRNCPTKIKHTIDPFDVTVKNK